MLNRYKNVQHYSTICIISVMSQEIWPRGYKTFYVHFHAQLD